MKFQVLIDCKNDAFEEQPGAEVAAILTNVATEVCERAMDDLTGFSMRLLDTNGNTVGVAEVVE